MKKITFLILLILTAFTLNAQLRYGVRGNLQFTNVSDIHGTSKTRTAAAAGLVFQIPIGNEDQYYFNPEILYSLQGERDSQELTKNVKYFQNYINIPLMFRAFFSEDPSEFFAEIGPQISFLVHEKNKEIDYAKLESFDYSIGFGIGYSFDRKYEFSARYNFGLKDAYPDYKGQNRTSNLQFSFAYIFN